MAITKANGFGVTKVAVPTAGNAGGALAAYAARAGMEAWVFMPRDTPVINQKECLLAGAHTVLVDGLITDCGRLVRDGVASRGWFDVSTLKEPYRIEGKKTMGLELAEQLGWELPDVILYPTGGGTGLIGMWKAFQELEALGWLPSRPKPRMIACQSDGCAPIVRAFEAGEEAAEPWRDPETQVYGLRVPKAVGDFLILRALRETGGRALAVAEEHLAPKARRVAAEEGLLIGPEGAACFLALDRLVAEGALAEGDRVVIFQTGHPANYDWRPGTD
jgi:threonine synthase